MEESKYLDKQGLRTLIDQIKTDFISQSQGISLTSDEIDEIIETAANEAYELIYGENDGNNSNQGN